MDSSSIYKAALGRSMLENGNYRLWASQIRAVAFNSSCIDHYTSGHTRPTLPTPATTEDQRTQREWVRDENIAIGLILTSISENNKWLVDNQTPALSASQMWEKLRATHNPQDAHNQFTLLQEFITTYQEPKESLTEYNGRLIGIQEVVLASFPAGASAADIINVLLPCFKVRISPVLYSQRIV